MKLIIAAVGTRMPDWISAGFNDYARRLPSDCSLELREIRPEPRNTGKTASQLMKAEAARLLATIPRGAIVVALDEHGHDLSTMDIRNHLEQWRASCTDVVFLIGGPDGLDAELKRKAHLMWRVSSMTLPHPLVRIILAEQLYRAWSILCNHPYHRA